MLMNGTDLNTAVASKEKGTVPWAIVYKKTPQGTCTTSISLP